MRFLKKILPVLFVVFASYANAQTDCKTALESCLPKPVPKGCPAGKKWSLEGTGIAHCVDEKVTPPPSCPNGATNYPSCTVFPPPPPSCPNGATNYPDCTAFPPPPSCPNGATNYPNCTVFPPPPVCSNGTPDYPTCTRYAKVMCFNSNADASATLPSIGWINGYDIYVTYGDHLPIADLDAKPYPVSIYPSTRSGGVFADSTTLIRYKGSMLRGDIASLAGIQQGTFAYDPGSKSIDGYVPENLWCQGSNGN